MWKRRRKEKAHYRSDISASPKGKNDSQMRFFPTIHGSAIRLLATTWWPSRLDSSSRQQRPSTHDSRLDLTHNWFSVSNLSLVLIRLGSELGILIHVFSLRFVLRFQSFAFSVLVLIVVWITTEANRPNHNKVGRILPVEAKKRKNAAFDLAHKVFNEIPQPIFCFLFWFVLFASLSCLYCFVVFLLLELWFIYFCYYCFGLLSSWKGWW